MTVPCLTFYSVGFILSLKVAFQVFGRGFWYVHTPTPSSLLSALRSRVLHFAAETVLNVDSTPANIDILTATATELRAELDAQRVSSVDLVQSYVQQISKHNVDGVGVRAVVTVAETDQLLERARQLDGERRTRGSRGPLHGIPVPVKDAYLTGTLGMGTTCGSFAKQGAKTTENATVVNSLLDAGAIIMGKASLTEWGASKANRQRSGWSAVFGQTQSPYVRGGVVQDATFLGHSTPCGSSSGSAVGVAAGFSPLAIGTESDGSVVQRSTRAALYGLKCSLGTVDTRGVQGVSPAFDCLGGMAKSTADLASLINILQGRDDLQHSITGSWSDLNIGFVDPALWQPADFVVEANEGFRRQTFAAIEEAAVDIKHEGGGAVQPISLITLPEIAKVAGLEIEDLMNRDLAKSLELWFSHFHNDTVKTVRDLIKFNQQNADRELPSDKPGQEVLIAAAGNKMTDEEYRIGLEKTRTTARAAIDKTFEDYRLDAILAPADARMASVAAAAGYPVGEVPLGFADFNGRAFGMNILTRDGEEAKMLQVMSAWEKTFPESRRPPKMLVD